MLLSLFWLVSFLASQPVMIKADEVTSAKGKSTFTGNVIVTTEKLKITSGKLELITLKKRSQAVFTQSPIASKDNWSCKCQTMFYYHDSEVLECVGDVLMFDGETTIEGARLSYSLKTKEAIVAKPVVKFCYKESKK